jgi:light-regulated signal transduction histidine kinase (bacteriophytochrome)
MGIAGARRGNQTVPEAPVGGQRTEAELRKRNQELEHQLLERTRQRDAALADLEDFNYSISHELRAPLRAIDNFSKILLEEHSGQLDVEGQRLFQVVRKNAATMGQLINGMLAFARAARRNLTLADVDLTALARDVIEELSPTMGGRQFNVRISAATHIYADTGAIHDVLTRLLSNAIKFTRPRSVAEIEIAAFATDREIVCSVRDNGAGFEPEYGHKLFSVFQRLHAADEFEGIGVGLGIVKRLIDAHGGRVWAQGAPDQGATFYFALPRLEPGAPEGMAS